MAATATKIADNVKNLDVEVHLLEFTSTTATVEVSTNLSEIYCVDGGGVMFGANDGHGNGAGRLELDEAYDATTKIITVSEGAVTFARHEGDDDTALADENFIVFLFGKS